MLFENLFGVSSGRSEPIRRVKTRMLVPLPAIKMTGYLSLASFFCILERFFGLKGDRVKSRCKLLWRTAEVAAPAKKVATWNLTLLDFGAMVCTARNPLCFQCPLQKKCKFVA